MKAFVATTTDVSRQTDIGKSDSSDSIEVKAPQRFPKPPALL